MSESSRPAGRAEGSTDAAADREARARKTEQALAAAQAENRALARKLEELDAELGEALVDSARRAAAQRKAFDEMAQRAARLEADLAALSAKDSARGREPEAPPESSGRIAELEKEKEALAARLAAAERARDKAMADAAALVEREAKQAREWEASRREWAERVGQAESLRAERQTLVTLMVAAERSRDRALAEATRLGQAHRAELDAQRQLVDQVKSEAAAMAQREARKAEAWQTARAELEAKIARLEQDAAVAAAARTDPSIAKPGPSRGTS